MDWKKLGTTLLFPCTAVRILLIPIATAFLVLSMVFLGTTALPSCLSYALAFYTLTVWCLRIPDILRFFGSVKRENRYVKRWLSDPQLRTRITMYGSLLWNAAYAVMQFGLGVIHSTFWFYSLAGYYFCLALMRLYLLRHIKKNRPGEKMRQELLRYRTCGWIFLLLNLTLTILIFFMVYWNRTFHHHEITTITLAAYTFTAFTMAIVNSVKYRKYNSPALSAGKAISLASACVSMLTLTSTMLTTFNDGSVDLVGRRIILGATGGAVSVFIIVMAIFMIVRSTKRLRAMTDTEEK